MRRKKGDASLGKRGGVGEWEKKKGGNSVLSANGGSCLCLAAYSLSFWCRKGYSGTGGNKRGGRSMYEKKATSVVFICFTEEKRT